VYNFYQSVLCPTQPTPSVDDTYYAITFQAGDLTNNISSFGNLFDQFRINKVAFEIIPEYSDQLASNAPNLGTIKTVVDYDSQLSTPSTSAQMDAYQSIKTTSPFVKVHSRTLIPKTSMPVYNGISAAYVVCDKPMWIDLANYTVPHYGLFVKLPGGDGTNTNWTFRCNYWLSFKNVR